MQFDAALELDAESQPRPPLRNVFRAKFGVVPVEQIFDRERDFTGPAFQVERFGHTQVDPAESQLGYADANGVVGALLVERHAGVPGIRKALRCQDVNRVSRG